MSSSHNLGSFPYLLDFDILGDCRITATRDSHGPYTGEDLRLDLASVFDEFLKTPTKPKRKEIWEFFENFIQAAISHLQVDLRLAFLEFDIDNDETTFDAVISSKLEKIKRRLIDSIRQSIQHEAEDSVGTDLVEKLLDDSGARLLLSSLNTESLLAASLDRDLETLFNYWEDDEDPDQLELKLAKYEVRRRGLTIRDNGPLISRLQEDIRARIQAFNTPIKGDGEVAGVSGHFQPGDSHIHRKTQLERHRNKGRKSSSEGIWKHITISRDETSASDFQRERIFILFLRRHFQARKYGTAEYNNLRKIEGSKLLRQEQQHHSFPTYTRLKTSGEKTSSDQTPHQNAEYQSSPDKRSRNTVHMEEMDAGKQGSAGVGTEGQENGSKTLILDELQNREVVSRIMPFESEDRILGNGQGAWGNWKMIHSLPHSIGQPPSVYLDKPVWAPGFGRDNFHLRAFLPVSNVEEYVRQSDFDFTIFRCYSESSLMPALRRALAKNQSPPDPVHYHEQIQLHSQQMIEALQEFFTYQPDLLKNFPSFDARAPIIAPYIFWYTSRSTAALQQLSLPHQDLIRTLTSWIDQNYEERYDEATRNLEKGVVTLRTMPFLLCPGEVLVWKEKGKIKAAMASSQVIQRTPPILYWDSSQVQMVKVSDSNSDGAKRGEFSTTWGVDIWSYKFNGEFLRDKRSTEIKFKGSSLEQEVEISKLGVYPLKFADEKTRGQLETRGKMFWTCRYRNLVSHTGEEGLFADGERFMVDFQVYKQLHSDSIKFKLLYEEDSSSDGSDDGEDDNDEENTYKMSTEAMASDMPPSQPYIYLFPNTVPGYNLRSKKWVDLEVDDIKDVEWNKKSFENLVIDAKAKEMIQALVSHQIESEKGTDLIHRKGNGLIILLHGGPGTGKTFTAESVAEIAQKPLFCVTCGDIGTKPEEVEKYLESVLHLGKTWGCVVLIDEAEVFLEQRSLDNLERNALVSVFLRVLEYYEGILILTTNRVGTFDEAFKSRILLSLHYEKLIKGQRQQIWRGFINHLEATHVPSSGQESGRRRNGGSSSGKHDPQADLPEIDYQQLRDYLEELANHELNGRQIRNIITTARQLAKFRKKTLDYDLVKEVISVSGKFDEYFSKVNDNQSDEQIARSDGLR